MNIIEALRACNLTIASAESLTCGMVSSLIADISGASAYFKGGVASYSKEAKAKLLGIALEDIEKHGVYSSFTALAMAREIKNILNSDIGISTTGVAGPSSDEEVEAGTVYFGIVIKDKEYSLMHKFTGDRNEVRLQASKFLLEELIKILIG